MASVVNTFTEGMNKDVNTMVAGLDILTDALNATIVTYNGDEFVLQQDFGNGRVETAYLPKGYVPVGIKEYAGIIYVACYNPMNGLCQVGSFPSPERNISSEELSKLENTNTFKTSESFSSIYEVLSNNDIVRPGDKFAINLDITTTDINTDTDVNANLLDLIYNYQTDESAANLIKLDLAIKTSDGNTIVITDKLKKVSIRKDDKYNFQDQTGEVLNDGSSEKDELIPDNQYFYILEDLKYTISEGETEDNKKIKINHPEITGFWASTGDMSSQELEDYRELVNGKYLNVFNNKIAGLLVLVVSIPSINSFSISVDSSKNTNNDVTLTFYPTIEFEDIRQMVWFGGFILLTEYSEKNNNFEELNEDKMIDPDNTNISQHIYYVSRIERTGKNGVWDYTIKLKEQSDNFDYKQLEYKYVIGEGEGSITETGKDLTLRKNEIINSVSIQLDDNEKFEITYNTKEGGYVNGYIKYLVRPFMRYLSLSTYQVSDVINVSLINSGDCSLTRWNWFTNVDKGIFNLRYGITAYNTNNFKFTQVLFYGYSLFDNIDSKVNKTYDLNVGATDKINYSDLKDNCDILFSSEERSSLNGVFTQSLYKNDNFNMQDLYVVRIFVKTIKTANVSWDNNPLNADKYYLIDDNDDNTRYYLLETRLFMTTSMFNNEYVNKYNTCIDFNDLEYKNIEYTVFQDNTSFKLIQSVRELDPESKLKQYEISENIPFKANYNTLYTHELNTKLLLQITNYNDLLKFPYDFTFNYGSYNLSEKQLNVDNNDTEYTSVKLINDDLLRNKIDNKFCLLLKLLIQETFSGKYSILSAVKLKAFTPFYSINTSSKIYGIDDNGNLNLMLCCFAVAYDPNESWPQNKRGGHGWMILVNMSYTKFKNLSGNWSINGEIDDKDIFICAYHLNTDHDDINFFLKNNKNESENEDNDTDYSKTLYFNPSKRLINNEENKNRTLDLSIYSIIPIFFLGRNKHTPNLSNDFKTWAKHFTADTFSCKFTSSLHISEQDSYDIGDYSIFTHYALMFNLGGGTLTSFGFIDKLRRLDFFEDNEGNIKYSSLISNLNNVYYYNDNDKNIYLIDTKIFKNYNFTSKLNITYNVELNKYKEKPLNNYINEFIDKFKDDLLNYTKKYNITLNLSVYKHLYDIVFNNYNYNNLTEYFGSVNSSSLKPSIGNVEDNFNLHNVYLLLNHAKTYDLTSNYAPASYEYLNGANVLTNILACNNLKLISILPEDRVNWTTSKINDQYKDFKCVCAEENSKAFSLCNFYMGGYVIQNSTF